MQPGAPGLGNKRLPVFGAENDVAMQAQKGWTA
jgi:hypothetical protein